LERKDKKVEGGRHVYKKQPGETGKARNRHGTCRKLITKGGGGYRKGLRKVMERSAGRGLCGVGKGRKKASLLICTDRGQRRIKKVCNVCVLEEKGPKLLKITTE